MFFLTIQEQMIKKKPEEDFKLTFNRFLAEITDQEKAEFENNFFEKRLLLQKKNLEMWMKMNPLTEFGETLANLQHPNTYIVTTKNKQATNQILDHYSIGVEGVYSNKDVSAAGSKGNLLAEVMNNLTIKNAIFIDDAVEHLDSVTDPRIKCYFANWGYGENTHYESYSFK